MGKLCVWVLALTLTCAATACKPQDATPAPVTEAPKAPTPPPAPRVLQVVPVTSSSPEALAFFNRARTLAENNRDVEALPLFRKAIEADPNFASAHSYLGFYMLGSSEGLSHLKRAVELAKENKLPESEELFLELYLTERMGDFDHERLLLEHLVKVAPDEWRITFEFGQLAYEHREWESAVTAFTRAIDIVQSCLAYNNLGYALGMEDRFDLAVAALRRCSQLSPNEPNPNDSMGEVQLAAAKLNEAQTSFRRAIELDPKFVSAYHGLAVIDASSGKWDDALEELNKGRQSIAGLQSVDELELGVITAWMQLSRGRPDAALTQLDTAERRARELKAIGNYHLAHIAVSRSQILTEMGRYPEAIAAANVGLQRAQQEGLQPGAAHALRRRAYVRRAVAEIKLNKLAEASKSIALIENESSGDPPLSEATSALHLVRGMYAAAKGDLVSAKSELLQCNLAGLTLWNYDYRNKPEDLYCAWQGALVATKLNEPELAEKLHRAILQKPSRDPMYLYLLHRLNPTEGTREKVGPPHATAAP